MKSESFRWAVLIAANVAVYGVLSFYQSTSAQITTGGQLPFANAVEQRNETIRQLQETNTLLREQNALLRSGNLVVTVREQR